VASSFTLFSEGRKRYAGPPFNEGALSTSYLLSGSATHAERIFRGAVYDIRSYSRESQLLTPTFGKLSCLMRGYVYGFVSRELGPAR
jgi:hypothetical protein